MVRERKGSRKEEGGRKRKREAREGREGGWVERRW